MIHVQLTGQINCVSISTFLGPSHSKLTTSLVNVSLKFQNISEICSAKASLIFFNKKISFYLVIKL